MNIHFVYGVIPGLLLGVLVWFLHRQYKRVARRCCVEGCGSLKVKRVHFIILPWEEVSLSFSFISPTSPLPEKVVSVRHPMLTLRWFIFGLLLKGMPRWWIRRVTKVTFSVCENERIHPIHRNLVKLEIDEPISLWHAWWVKWFHKEQYFITMEYRLCIDSYRREMGILGGKTLKKKRTDTPNLIQGVVQDVQDFMGQTDVDPEE